MNDQNERLHESNYKKTRALSNLKSLAAFLFDTILLAIILIPLSSLPHVSQHRHHGFQH